MHYDWKTLSNELGGCQKCGLCRTRHTVVIGEGDIHADVMFIGEGPGYEEDMQGRPFVGPAGQLLDKMMASIDLDRNNSYIANIVKCRPPGNRDPLDDEAAACIPYLRAQFALVRPKVIVCLGRIAAKHIYDPDVRITRDRGKLICKKGVWIMPMYHPSFLLRDENRKREAWLDLQSLRDKLASLNTDQIK